MDKFSLKIKTKNGDYTWKYDKPDTVADFKQKLSNLIGISSDYLQVLTGFPPKRLNLDDGGNTFSTCDINSGDTIIVEHNEPKTDSNKTESNTPEAGDYLEESYSQKPAVLLRKVVPADNSCLFTSIGFVLGGCVDVTCGAHMRQIIAEEVSNDIVNFNEAILGRPNDEYCRWILCPDSWGGAIELAVLSKFYAMEIVVVNTVNAIINQFGEDQLYDYRVFLMFDGVHYDPLYSENLEADGEVQTIFPAADDSLLDVAAHLAVEARNSNQFTDLNKFTLKCQTCCMLFAGQEQAMLHAKETGHGHFGETSS